MQVEAHACDHLSKLIQKFVRATESVKNWNKMTRSDVNDDNKLTLPDLICNRKVLLHYFPIFLKAFGSYSVK